MQTLKKIFENKIVRQAFFIALLLAVWQYIVSTGNYSELILPGLRSIWNALLDSIASGEMGQRTSYSLYLIGKALAIGTTLALALTALAMLSSFIADFVKTITTIFNPLPGVALLPIALLWFGIGENSIILILVHSIIWPLILNTYTGFRSVSRTQLEVGRNLGLRGLKLVSSVMVPSAFPYILTGFKISWSNSWRSLVAAEMIFGASGGQGGLGWLIYQKRFFLETPSVFAALFVIILIGILVENVFFAQIEKWTVLRWGMVIRKES
ncbi:MAG: sulfonate transport system permease protein [Chloroflexota bacterium]|nr:sulfonate transport system permease protein [Chloroflexota bacterium]